MVRGGLGEGGIGGGKAAEDFVRGDVEEAENVGFFWMLGEVVAGGFEEVKGSQDVGFQKLARGVDGAVDMGFGGEVEDGVGPMGGEKVGEKGGVLNVALLEVVAGVGGGFGEVFRASGVGEEVEIDNFGGAFSLEFGGGVEEVVDEVGADEAGPAGDEDGHEVSFRFWFLKGEFRVRGDGGRGSISGIKGRVSGEVGAAGLCDWRLGRPVAGWQLWGWGIGGKAGGGG